MMDADDRLRAIREALTETVGEQHDMDGSVLTGYVIVAEWAGHDSRRWLTHTAGDINDEEPPVWTIKGWLGHALDTADEDDDGD